MKVCVYAICKNESQFVGRWMDSMSEADGIYVLDTGSDDGTPELLAARGAVVEVERISPWRFDTARNRSLALVPADADICVCTDLDEVLARAAGKRLDGGDKAGRLPLYLEFQPRRHGGSCFLAGEDTQPLRLGVGASRA